MSPPLGNPLAGSVDVVVIGAGHSGLAMSRYLSLRSIDHVILERGEIANSWKTERWDSLKLLTPNWQSRLPGYEYAGQDRDAYMSMNEVIDFIQGYADYSRAPVLTGTEVTTVEPQENGYRVITNRGEWRTRVLVVASGAFNVPVVPAVSEGLPSVIEQITTHDYRNPDQLHEGGVLVIGASATGLQLAAEIQQSGRPVTLAVGEHVRMPRTYRGKDIQYWMHVAGLLDERYDKVDDIRRARTVPSPQLVGTSDRRTLDLNALGDTGVRLAGRLAGVRDGKVQFSGSLRNVCKLADLKMNRMLDTIDEWVAACGPDEPTEPTERFAPTDVADSPCLGLDLRKEEIRTVVWATGFRPDYSWLDVPVLDRKGQIRHDGGVADAPGMYVMGLPYLRRRKSSFIHGADDDARDLSQHLADYLDVSAFHSRTRIAV
jgi:putative flavoprotein involved in K+ transport